MRSKSYLIAPLTDDQLLSLIDYARINGRTWKSRLGHEWMVGCRDSFLQQVRNQFGPSWLARITDKQLVDEAIARNI